MIVTKKEHQFENPEMDTLLGVVISLGNEVWVMRDRMRVIEKLLESKGTISRADIEAYKPTPEEEEEIRKDNDAFMARLFRVFEGDME
jgi:DNA-directed RNA polymerase delta subunit